MPDCKLAKNKEKCSCTYENCSRKGFCCECVSYHLSNQELPGCFFSKNAERTYDRSINNFIKDKLGKDF
jgi:hypothetical protein